MEESLSSEYRDVVFRNYIPRDENLKRLYKPTLEDYSIIENTIDEQINDTIHNYETEDVLSLVRPRRQNWDLKRELNRKREILSTRTDRAILKLLHQNKGGDQTNSEVLLQQMAHTMSEENQSL